MGEQSELRRRSIRLKGYDYSQSGAYFVTIVTQGRVCLFGDVVEDRMRLNGAGEMVKTAWEGLPRRFRGVGLDVFVVMPNHVHGIIVMEESVGVPLVGTQDGGRVTTRVTPTLGDGGKATTRVTPTLGDGGKATTRVAPTLGDEGKATTRVAPTLGDGGKATTRVTPTLGDGGKATTRVAPTLGDAVGAYKSMVTVEYARGVKACGWRRFDGRLWQRNYYEHVIRDEDELDRAREYIVNNPLKWALDRENPAVAGQS